MLRIPYKVRPRKTYKELHALASRVVHGVDLRPWTTKELLIAAMRRGYSAFEASRAGSLSIYSLERSAG